VHTIAKGMQEKYKEVNHTGNILTEEIVKKYKRLHYKTGKVKHLTLL